MSSSKTKIMIVDDSVLIRKYVSRIIDSIDNMEIVTTAPNGKIGLQKYFLYKPEVIILDIEMPELNGIEFLKYIEEKVPAPERPDIIMFSSVVGEGTSITFEALAHGAADFIKKPEGKINENLEEVKRELELKINEIHSSKVSSKLAVVEKRVDNKGLTTLERDTIVENKTLYGLSELDSLRKTKQYDPEIIAVGSSTGGPNAIRTMLTELKQLPVPMVIAQHMPTGFTSEFANNLGNVFNRKVIEPENSEELQNGVIYICPGGVHSKIEKVNGKLVYIKDSKEYEGFFFKPSVDLFFESVYKSVGKNTLAVILSGMGKDGSIESINLRRAGAIVIAQDKESSVVWGMPGNSVKNGGVDIIIEIKDMGKAINRLVQKT